MRVNVSPQFSIRLILYFLLFIPSSSGTKDHMFLPKKPNTSSRSHPKVIPIQGYGRQLKNLYARHSAVETLIQSLEQYQRFRAQRTDRTETKTA